MELSNGVGLHSHTFWCFCYIQGDASFSLASKVTQCKKMGELWILFVLKTLVQMHSFAFYSAVLITNLARCWTSISLALMKNVNEEEKKLNSLATMHLRSFFLLGYSDCLGCRDAVPCITQTKLLPKCYRVRVQVAVARNYTVIEIHPLSCSMQNLDGTMSLKLLKFLNGLWKKVYEQWWFRAMRNCASSTTENM